MRWLVVLLALAACQMQAGQGSDVAGISEDEIAVSALPTAPSGTAGGVDPPTATADLPTAPSGTAGAVALPTDGTLRPKLRPETAPLAEAPLQSVPPVEISPEERKCVQAGGQWAKVGDLGRICVHPTREQGKACRKKSDCNGECLAQSGTCAPISPLMGCNEILDDQGRRMTQCLQ